MNHRPVFARPEDYVADVKEGRLTGTRTFTPTTVFELVAIKDECPEFFAEVCPARRDLEMIVRQCRLWSKLYGDDRFAEAADALEHDPVPQSDGEFDALLLKLTNDPDANAALLAALAGGPAL